MFHIHNRITKYNAGLLNLAEEKNWATYLRFNIMEVLR